MNILGFKRQVVAQHERALVRKNGVLTGILGAGVYRWLDPTKGLEVQVFDLTRAELVHPQAEVFRKEAAALWDAQVQTVETGEQETALVTLDGRLTALIPPASRRFYWKGPVEVRVERFDIGTELAVPSALLRRMRLARGDWTQLPAAMREKARGLGKEPVGADFLDNVYQEEVPENHVGLLIVDGRLVGSLGAGVHAFWNFARNVAVEQTDLRLQELEVQGQEILTLDKVSLRVNLTAHYRVVDPVRVRAALPRPKDWLYRELQLGLRQAVGERSLDDLLAEKGALEQGMHARIGERAQALGLAVDTLGLKDIILPGEMKQILNQVVEADKAAQANLIRRREETAATRSLLNTAKLMEQNPILLRLKELETLERITERVGSLTVFDGLESVLKGLVRIEGAKGAKGAEG